MGTVPNLRRQTAETLYYSINRGWTQMDNSMEQSAKRIASGRLPSAHF